MRCDDPDFPRLVAETTHRRFLELLFQWAYWPDQPYARSQYLALLEASKAAKAAYPEQGEEHRG